MGAKLTEKQVAELVAKFEQLFEGDDNIVTTMDKVKTLASEFSEIKALDLKKVVSEYDRLRAGQETLERAIRNSKRGLYVPGIEDQEFSLVKALTGIKTGKWEGREREKEILDAARTKATQNIGNDSAGGYFVPDQVIPDVIAAIYTRSVFVNLGVEGDMQSISLLDGLVGGNIKIPKFNSGTVAYWIGEEDAYAQSVANVGDVAMNPKKLGVLVKLTDAMMRFGGFGFENLLRTDMVRAAAKKLDYTVAFGTGGADMPLGICQTPGIKIYSASADAVVDHDTLDTLEAGDWTGADLTFDGLDNMTLALEEDDVELDDTHKWVGPPRFFKRLKQLKVENYASQTTGQPYLLGIPMLPDNRLADIIGPWSKSTQFSTTDLPGASVSAPTTSTDELHGTVIGGNLGDVVLGRWAGIEVDDDAGKGTGFATDHTFIKLRLYVDIVVRQPRSLIVCPNAQVRD